jgi:iron complex outermembrane receptor protein
MESISDPIDADAWAVYGEIEYEINDQWSLQVGLRHHDEERKYTSIYALGFTGDPLFGPYSLPSPTTVEKSEFDHTSYRLGVTWRPSTNGTVYLTQSTASRAPIILPQSERIALENAGIEPVGGTDAHELLNTELGTKWMLLDGSMQFELVYAYGNWKDVPLWAEVQIPPTPVAMAIGGTDAVVESWEMAVTWVLNENIRLNYSGAYTDTEVKDTPSPDEVAGYPPAVQDGGELFNYSPWTHNLGINYNRTLANGWDMFASANYVTRDKADGINAFDLTATEFASSRDKYENLALDLGVTSGAWTLTFSVNNATDDDGMYQPGSEAIINGLIPAPRSYYVQLTYDAM